MGLELRMGRRGKGVARFEVEDTKCGGYAAMSYVNKNIYYPLYIHLEARKKFETPGRTRRRLNSVTNLATKGLCTGGFPA